MGTERLTTLPRVKDYLSINSDGSDKLLTDLIDAASQFALNWMNRSGFGTQTYTENLKGNGKTSLMLHNWPIQTITSVGVGGSFVPASVMGTAGMPGSGYMVSDARIGPQLIELYGYSFWRGAPVQVIYSAGFNTSETDTIPTGTSHTITPTNSGQWVSDTSVSIDGIDAVKVSGDPTAGEYSVDDWGTYTFASADQGKIVEIFYDYVPLEVCFAVTELVGEMFRRKDRIGVVSKTLAGQETVTFSQKDMSDSIRTALQGYANVIPI